MKPFNILPGGDHGYGRCKRKILRRTYISGSFWVSITAAIGIPKLETGPQKSAFSNC